MGVKLVEKKYDIFLKQKVIDKDIPKLSKNDKKKISQAIEYKLTKKPEIFSKPLRNSLKGYRSLRVGEYRVVLKIIKRECHILGIRHRKDIYQMIGKRI